MQRIDRGCGFELAGTRITIFDVLPFWEDGWHHTSVALWFGISSAQVLALKKYFDEHKEDVLPMNKKIVERIAYGNPPEVEGKRPQITSQTFSFGRFAKKKNSFSVLCSVHRSRAGKQRTRAAYFTVFVVYAARVRNWNVPDKISTQS